MLFVIEQVAIDLHPVTQAFTAGIIPRDAGPVDACAGGLSDNQDASGITGAQYRSRSKW